VSERDDTSRNRESEEGSDPMSQEAHTPKGELRTSDETGPARLVSDPDSGHPAITMEIRRFPDGLSRCALQVANGDWLVLGACATRALDLKPELLQAFEVFSQAVAKVVLDEIGTRVTQ
jgi:hypothetical protein